MNGSLKNAEKRKQCEKNNFSVFCDVRILSQYKRIKNDS